jgi:hypothetical protein
MTVRDSGRLSTTVLIGAERVLTSGAEEKRNQLLQWLAPVDPQDNHEKACRLHQDGTSTWFAESEQFTAFCGPDISRLWLSGPRK